MRCSNSCTIAAYVFYMKYDIRNSWRLVYHATYATRSSWHNATRRSTSFTSLSSLSRNVAYICMSNICCFETPADKLVNTREAAGLVCGGAGSCLSVPCWGRDLLKLRRWCRGVLLSCLLLYAAVVTLHFRVLLCVAMCCCMLFVLLCAAWTVVCCCRYCLLLWPSVCFMSTTSSITADKCFRPVSQITIETYSDIVQFIVPSNCRKIISTLVS